MRVYIIGVLFLLITNILDVFYTHNVLSSGVAVEANPLAFWIIAYYGFAGLAVFKIFVVSVIFGLLLTIHKKLGKIPDLIAALFWGSVVAYFVLTLYHFYIQAIT